MSAFASTGSRTCSSVQTSKVLAVSSPARPQRHSYMGHTAAIRSRSHARLPLSRQVVAMATSGEEVDFDKVLSDLADKFEKSDNKAAIVGYSAAAVGALWFSEWLIHLPLLNFLLGFPIQLLGLLLLPYFSIRYFVEGENIRDDTSKALDTVVKKLPGFDGK